MHHNFQFFIRFKLRLIVRLRFYFYEKAFKIFDDVDQQKLLVVKNISVLKLSEPFFTVDMVKCIVSVIPLLIYALILIELNE